MTVNSNSVTTYEFKVLAINKYGAGTASSAVSVVAATVPDASAAPTVAIDGSYVKISWVAPSTPQTYHYMPITDYVLKIVTSDGTTYVEGSACDGTAAFAASN